MKSEEGIMTGFYDHRGIIAKTLRPIREWPEHRPPVIRERHRMLLPLVRCGTTWCGGHW